MVTSLSIPQVHLPLRVNYYDEVQELLKAMAGMDELLLGNNCIRILLHGTNDILGMLSKSHGQVLRIATVLHMLFSIDNPEEDNFLRLQ